MTSTGQSVDSITSTSTAPSDDLKIRPAGLEDLETLVKAGKQAGLHSAVARIVEGNPVSVRLLEKAGFRTVGIMSRRDPFGQEAGYKFGRYLDVIIMSRRDPLGEKLLDGSRK